MAFFYSPMKAIKVITDAQKTVLQNKRKDSGWFFSEEGKAAYLAANTVGKKTAFFFDYFIARLAKKRYGSFGSADHSERKNMFLKVAYVMAAYVDGKKSFSFSSYPEILKEASNPFIKFACEGSGAQYEIKNLICDVRGVRAAEIEDGEFYKTLESDASSDAYKLERAIISLFIPGASSFASGGFPFDYSILSRTDDDGDSVKALDGDEEYDEMEDLDELEDIDGE